LATPPKWEEYLSIQTKTDSLIIIKQQTKQNSVMQKQSMPFEAVTAVRLPSELQRLS